MVIARRSTIREYKVMYSIGRVSILIRKKSNAFRLDISLCGELQFRESDIALPLALGDSATPRRGKIARILVFLKHHKEIKRRVSDPDAQFDAVQGTQSNSWHALRSGRGWLATLVMPG